MCTYCAVDRRSPCLPFSLSHRHAGRILGKALMDGQITPVHLIQPLYKHLMGWPVTFKDLEHIDDQV
jgi:E3 ubiquitin-protein ligase NEDD4